MPPTLGQAEPAEAATTRPAVHSPEAWGRGPVADVLPTIQV